MSRRSKQSNSNNTVEMEVNNLFNLKNKQQFTNALLALRRKYKDEELIARIQKVFTERHSKIVKGSKKFAEAIRKRYSQSDVPFHQLLAKARAHAKKHDLSDSEFAEFQRMYEQELSGTSHKNEVVVPVTNMMKVLGNVTDGIDNHFKVDEPDFRNLQEILKINELGRPLHAQTMLQSLQYNDMDFLALNGKINRDSNNPGDHVHPVIAALFLPKINLLESHFLYSSISGIVKSRYNQEPLTTRPDYELFYSLVTDPNDVVCDSKTPVGDLLNRCTLQNQVWNSVLHLRNGQVYNPVFREFINSIDTCRLNKYDNPDMVYGRHDGTIIKRMLSAFSFRPTVITTIPISNVFATNPYAQNVRPTVTSIPMINVRLQQYQSTMGPLYGNSVQPAGPVKLSKCLSQPQTFIEGNTLVQRVSDVIYSREVLIFYVDRRANLLQYGTPFNLSRLPTAVAGFERINDYAVDIECSLTIRDTDKFCLRSVVVAETKKQVEPEDPSRLVVGSSTFLFDYDFVRDANGVTKIKGCDATTGSFLIGVDQMTELVAAVASANARSLDGGAAITDVQFTDVRWCLPAYVNGVGGVTIATTPAGFANAWLVAYTAWNGNKSRDNTTALDVATKAVVNNAEFKSIPDKYKNMFTFLPTGSCASASMLVHYNPLNAFKQENYYCYDVKTGRSVRSPALENTGPGGIARELPGNGDTTTLVRDNIVSIEKANDMIQTQGLVFVYQNFNFINSEKNMLML